MFTALLLAAVLAQTTGTHTYHVYFRPRFEAFGYAGELHLTFESNGYVKGTYRSDSGNGFTKPVSGGYQGNRVWFDVPTLGGIHVEATTNGEELSGAAASTGMNDRQYVFTATPEASP